MLPMNATIITTSKILDSQKEAMFRLHSTHFCSVHRDIFFRDMNEKDWVILLRDGQYIVGFSTLQVIHLSVDHLTRAFIFSGDTIVDPAHWHDSKLAGSFGLFLLRQIAEHPDTPLHWFLISKGYRTYRFLPVYFKRFFPIFNRPTPPEYERLISAIAVFKFNNSYDRQTGLIRPPGCCDHLNPKLATVSSSRSKDPHVRFFLEKNPHYYKGDELACLADISRDNLNKYAWRVIRNTQVVWDE